MARVVRSALSARYEEVRARMAAACARAGRPAEAVRLVAVSKRVPPDVVRAAVAAGVARLGESYVQEARAKRAALADLTAVEWHFIGRVQRNKAAAMTDFALVHSVADARVAAAIGRAATAAGVTVPVLIQVSLSGEPTKEGTTAAALPATLAAVRAVAGVRAVGLMTVPPPLAAEEVRPLFGALRALRDRQEDADALPELSMGMSGDYEVAIEEGATLIRVGTAIFGPRTEVT